MTDIEIIAKRNKEFLHQGRLEGGIWALIGMTFYLILIAAVLN